MNIFKSLISRSRAIAFVSGLAMIADLTSLSAPTGLVAAAAAQEAQRYSENEVLNAGHQFFGAASSGLATVV